MRLTYKFLRDKRGSVATIFGLLLLPMVLFTGVIVDVGRAYNMQNKIQRSLDAAVLAAVIAINRGEDKQKAQDQAKRVFSEYSSADKVASTFTPDFSVAIKSDTIEVSAKADGKVDTHFAKIAGFDTFDVGVSASSSYARPTDEITLVLDVSWSMRYGSKIQNMKKAAEAFVTQMQPFDDGEAYRIFNIVPFAMRVNMGSDFRDWVGSRKDDFVGCLEPEGDIVPATDRISNPAPGYYYPFNHVVHGDSGASMCPPDDSRIELFSSAERELTTRIRNMELGFGTATDIGVLWGWRTLSPNWRSEFGRNARFPKNYGKTNRKIMVVLTDGRLVRSDWKPYESANGKKTGNKTVEESFNGVCSGIRQQGEITVYTIGFNLDSADASMVTALKNCTSKGGRYFDANSSELEDVFKEIAEELSVVRITG